MGGIKATRIQAIPGGHFSDLRKWACTIEGKYVLTFVKFIILLCGGNSLANGMAPEKVFEEAKRTVYTLKLFATANCTIFISTLPPRPQIDITSNSRLTFNHLILSSTDTTFSTTDSELGLIEKLTNTPKPSILNQAEARGGRQIVHLSPTGIEQLRKNYARTFGKAKHGQIIPAYIIKKNEIGVKKSYHI